MCIYACVWPCFCSKEPPDIGNRSLWADAKTGGEAKKWESSRVGDWWFWDVRGPAPKPGSVRRLSVKSFLGSIEKRIRL